MAERQANRPNAADCANLAATAYGRTVLVLTDEVHATIFTVFHVSKACGTYIGACKE